MKSIAICLTVPQKKPSNRLIMRFGGLYLKNRLRDSSCSRRAATSVVMRTIACSTVLCQSLSCSKLRENSQILCWKQGKGLAIKKRVLLTYQILIALRTISEVLYLHIAIIILHIISIITAVLLVLFFMFFRSIDGG